MLKTMTVFGTANIHRCIIYRIYPTLPHQLSTEVDFELMGGHILRQHVPQDRVLLAATSREIKALEYPGIPADMQHIYFEVNRRNGI